MLLASIWSAPLHASETKRRAVPLAEGEAAPFAGQLLTPTLASELAVGAEKCLDKKKLELEHAERMCTLRLNGDRALLEGKLRSREAELAVVQQALDSALKREETKAVWEDPKVALTIGFVGGVALASAIAYASVWAVGQLRTTIP